jgi:hypothetical protein
LTRADKIFSDLGIVEKAISLDIVGLDKALAGEDVFLIIDNALRVEYDMWQVSILQQKAAKMAGEKKSQKTNTGTLLEAVELATADDLLAFSKKSKVTECAKRKLKNGVVKRMRFLLKKQKRDNKKKSKPRQIARVSFLSKNVLFPGQNAY